MIHFKIPSGQQQICENPWESEDVYTSNSMIHRRLGNRDIVDVCGYDAYTRKYTGSTCEAWNGNADPAA